MVGRIKEESSKVQKNQALEIQLLKRRYRVTAVAHFGALMLRIVPAALN